ncbi:MAG: hypothetical protein ACK4EX_10015 [Thermaurantimonas sp.]|uniref:hypothetical protein n=1 Tax=Thermaurantimonas sp. TaxID=2681568 RepID=UPI003919A693
MGVPPDKAPLAPSSGVGPLWGTLRFRAMAACNAAIAPRCRAPAGHLTRLYCCPIRHSQFPLRPYITPHTNECNSCNTCPNPYEINGHNPMLILSPSLHNSIRNSTLPPPSNPTST